jgi:hypothetical protein
MTKIPVKAAAVVFMQQRICRLGLRHQSVTLPTQNRSRVETNQTDFIDFFNREYNE